MPLFTGQFEKTIDAKNRIQLPAQHRSLIDPGEDEKRVYVTLGEYPGTLSIYTVRDFEQRASGIETEYMDDPRAKDFERDFYAATSIVEMDKQGRMVLPDRLRKKARLGEEIYVVGQKHRIDLWNRADFDRNSGINWEDESWPNWSGFLRMKPGSPKND